MEKHADFVQLPHVPLNISYSMNMRTAAALALSVLPVFASSLQIDHVTVAGSQLDAMRHAFTAATGIPTEYGGRHSNRATEMAMTSFPDGSYLEFMGLQAGADPAAVSSHVWSRFLKENAGPCAFALRVTDVNGEVARLRTAGLAVRAPVRSGRTRPDRVQLDWETSDVGTAVRGTFFPFLIHDLTPRSTRVYPSGQATTNNFSGIASVVIATENLEQAVGEYRRAFGLPAPRRQRQPDFEAELATFENTPIVLAQPLSARSWIKERIGRFGSGACAFVLSSRRTSVRGISSQWFDRKVFWATDRLGWHWGLETQE